jgi:hypothetical protein
MHTDTEMVDVMFRVNKRDGGDVFALMPGVGGTRDANTCTSYQHVGQHCSADLMLCIQHSRPATPEEYKPLLAELQRRGYAVNIITRATSRHREERIKAIHA